MTEKARARRLFQKGVSDGRDRDAFPLPTLTACADDDRKFSLKSGRRLQQRLGVDAKVANMSQALNTLYLGGSRRGRAVSSPEVPIRRIGEAPRGAQRVVLGHLCDAALHDSICPKELSPEKALRELLKEGGGSYATVSRGAVAPYSSGNVSLPQAPLQWVAPKVLMGMDSQQVMNRP